jgi:ABC-type antimicrobial peptide transport system permease subunit
MTIVALIACFLPAWRAARMNPVQALHVSASVIKKIA